MDTPPRLRRGLERFFAAQPMEGLVIARIVLGSSLVVYPAASFPAYAKQNGAQLVIINREPTEQDTIADLVLNREIGPTLGEALNVE